MPAISRRDQDIARQRSTGSARSRSQRRPRRARTTREATSRGSAPRRGRLRPQRRAGLQLNVVDDGCVVYLPERDRVHYMNPTAAVVLELCTGKNTWDAIIDLVKDAYGLKDRPEKTVSEVLTQMIDEGLVVLAP
jgi:hypothetical protein